MEIAALPAVVNNPNTALASDRKVGVETARAGNRQLNPNASNFAANDSEGAVLQGEVLYNRSTNRKSAGNNANVYTSTQRERPGYQPRSPANNFSRRVAIESYQQNEELAQSGMFIPKGSIDVYA